MLFSSNTSLFVLVLAAAYNSVTSATMLRGNAPSTTVADTPAQSLAVAQHTRMLLLPSLSDHMDVTQADLAVQSETGIAFISPPSTIKGSVCGNDFLTGNPVNIAGNGDYDLEEGELAYEGGCSPAEEYLKNLLEDAMTKTAKPIDMALGGKGFGPGTYSSTAFTIADKTNVTLTGGADDIFLFQATAAYMVTGANSNIILSGGAVAKNVLFVLAAAATTGADSTLQGSILAGAAITTGDRSDVSGYVLARAAMTVGEACRLNLENIGSDSSSNTSPIQTLIDVATCYDSDHPVTGEPIFIAQQVGGGC
jgi:hypothetical protein